MIKNVPRLGFASFCPIKRDKIGTHIGVGKMLRTLTSVNAFFKGSNKHDKNAVTSWVIFWIVYRVSSKNGFQKLLVDN